MEDSIFTKIIKGEIPCHKVYEDEHTIAFLDIHPVQPGHTLVVPKVQVDHFEDLDDAHYQAVWATVKKVSRAQKATYSPNRIGLQVIGLDVPHAHIHVYPFNTLSDFRNMPDMNAEPDHNELAKNAENIKGSLNA